MRLPRTDSPLKPERAGLNRRALTALLLGLPALAPGRASALDQAPALRRGMNIHNLLNWPEADRQGGQVTYLWPPFTAQRYQITDAALAELRLAGFDFIRLTVDPSILMASAADRQPELLAIIHRTIRQILGAGFQVVVDLHPVAVNPSYAPDRLIAAENPDLFTTYVDMVGRVAASLASLPPDRVAFELINEPRIVKAAELGRWQSMMERLHAAARTAAPQLPLVLTGAQWSSIDALLRLDPAPFKSSNVLYTFHFYDPHTFTHQGVPGEGAQYLRNMNWPPQPAQAEALLEGATARINADPKVAAADKDAVIARSRKLIRDYFGTPTGREVIDRRFDAVAAWAQRNGIPNGRVLLGEFGGVWRVSGSDGIAQDRVAWLAAVRSAAEARGFAWAYWAYELPLERDVLSGLGLPKS
ncbi:hypothetical protein ASF49_00025 [Methylobacterium sp. Leaf104]|uniref:glycoside hydrolase family 5 protein n=1 Tax=Methylobacterium TaxID=407 RepID=UPI0006FDC383|nr:MULTISPECIES: cellulase family glycosylhydrolase [Methylobacterium]KQP42289.1 hypothetical protein ASF49_00025 [Methylobacterium sp. Leaf104]MCI9879202.1 cellulase family glycosylhydrolase [Methylobacterium goesingense]